MKKSKNEGITLVALIVTIIILLILAGVTIALLSGEDGILSRTEKAATSYQAESIKEVVNLKLANLNASKWIDEGRKAVLKDLNELDDENSKNFDAEINLKNSVGDSDTNAILIYDKHEVEVDSDLNITKVDGEKQEGTSSGNSGSSNSGESGGNSSSMDSAEYRQMQATIAQLQKEVAELKTQSGATKDEVGTIKENYATKTELDNANSKIDSAQNQIDHMLVDLDVDSVNVLFDGQANAEGSYKLEDDVKNYKYLIVYPRFTSSSGTFNARPIIVSVSQIIELPSRQYYTYDGASDGSILTFNFESDFEHFDIKFTKGVGGFSKPIIYRIEGIN